MSACVSPPHDSTSHIVDVAASIAHAASTALPPAWKIIAPAVAASGLPVIAIHSWPCRTGRFGGPCAMAGAGARGVADAASARSRTDGGRQAIMGSPWERLPG